MCNSKLRDKDETDVERYISESHSIYCLYNY